MPMPNSPQEWGGAPAWDPSSPTPISNADTPLLPSPELVKDTEVTDETAPPSGLPKDWLASDAFHGKPVRLKISGTNRKNCSWEDGIYEYKAVVTMGTPVSGDSPTSQVILLTSPPHVMSIPLCFLAPVHPIGPARRKERALIITGDDVGTEVTILDTREPLWSLEAPNRSTPLFRPPEHLTTASKIRKSPYFGALGAWWAR